MPGNHAILSPSGASRWLTCTPSARLEETFEENSSEAASEGTLAHALGELLIGYKLGRVAEEDFNDETASIIVHPLYTSSMWDYCEDYAAFVLERYAEAQARTSDALIFLEEKIDLTSIIPEGFGTGDVIIIADGLLEFIDLKYGKGVPVAAEKNKQLKIYGLGALEKFDHIYDVDIVRLTIYQPRIDNTSSWEIPAVDLRKWAEEEVKPRALLAFAGEGEYVPGDHCRFCRARAVCKANADANLELAKYEFKDAALLNEEEVADILRRADDFESWLKAVEHYALSEAVNKGKKWPGFKVVEGRSNRCYKNEADVAQTLTAAGFAEEIIYTKKLLGITEMTKTIGKKVFDATISPLLIKPPGKPKLAPLDDKRPAYNTTESAKLDFADEVDN